ncbi:MAG: hypothetical protein JNJ82_17335 [Opitutaceae bacterium]|nr:hypothetical protein [Opitutaceae bacterium]
MTAPAPSALRTVWTAPALAGPLPPLSQLSPARIDESWMRLGQSWRSEGPETGFQSGWARVSWEATQFCWEAVFLTGRAANRARRLNERTWELGDVCEVFVQEMGADHYFELHITPENQRLQLRFDAHGIERLRSGVDPLESFLLPQADWVQSSTHLGPGYWSTRVLLPAARFGPLPLTPARTFLGTVCRYDCEHPGEPVLSATAALSEPFYHRRQEWSTISLSPRPGST